MRSAAAPVEPPPAPRLKLVAPSESPQRRGAGGAACPAPCIPADPLEPCLPCALADPFTGLLGELVYTRKRVHRGESLYRAGGSFDSLFAIRSGFFKSRVMLEDGRDQVTGFHMAGEILGMDGIGTERHNADAIALEESEVCIIPYEQLVDFHLQRELHKVMSRELVRDHGLMMLLGTMKSEERLAAFLLNLSQRFVARGFSPDDFHLRMTRDEIGSYIGLSLETVSRLFSRFHEEGLIAVQQKHIRILDVPGLRRVMVRATERADIAWRPASSTAVSPAPGGAR